MSNVYIWLDEREGNTCLKHRLNNFEQSLTEQDDEYAIGGFQFYRMLNYL